MAKFFKRHQVHEHCSAELLLSGKPYFDKLRELITGAKHYLHIQFYIFDEDLTGREFIGLLIDASKRGVKVMMVVDAYASSKLSSPVISRIRESGILFKQFSPVKNKYFRVGRRLHHKIVVADGETALLGGINVADKYSGFDGKEPWLDFGVELKGTIIRDIERICEDVWRTRVFRRFYKVKYLPERIEGSLAMRLTQNDWWRRRIEISKAYKDLIRKSETELCIVASYMLPGNSFRRLIRQASARGVKIRILLGGFSDVQLVKPATKFLYEWLLKQDIEIYEWNRSVLHGKLAIADGRCTTIGSYNINALSDYGSLELNVEVYDKEFAEATRKKVEELIELGGERITYDKFKKQSTLLLYAYRWACFQIVRILFRILFLMMYRDRFREKK